MHDFTGGCVGRWRWRHLYINCIRLFLLRITSTRFNFSDCISFDSVLCTVFVCEKLHFLQTNGQDEKTRFRMNKPDWNRVKSGIVERKKELHSIN